MEDDSNNNVSKRNPNTSKNKGKTRETSRDVVATWEARIARLELAIADGNEKFEEVGVSMEGFEKGLEDLEERMLGTMNRLIEDHQKERDALRDAIGALAAQLEEIKGELTTLRTTGNTVGLVRGTPKIKAPEPKKYNGTRDAKELDNFLWQMQQYFEAISLEDERIKVRTASLYLSDTAILWWRRRCQDIERGTVTIDTWDDFKREIQRQFYPENVEFLARRNLNESPVPVLAPHPLLAWFRFPCLCKCSRLVLVSVPLLE